jgi:hypothetical protein
MNQTQNVATADTGKVLVEMQCAASPKEKMETYDVVASSLENAINLFKRKHPNYHVVTTKIMACERMGYSAPASIRLIVEE